MRFNGHVVWYMIFHIALFESCPSLKQILRCSADLFSFFNTSVSFVIVWGGNVACNCFSSYSMCCKLQPFFLFGDHLDFGISTIAGEVLVMLVSCLRCAKNFWIVYGNVMCSCLESIQRFKQPWQVLWWDYWFLITLLISKILYDTFIFTLYWAYAQVLRLRYMFELEVMSSPQAAFFNCKLWLCQRRPI